MLAASFSLVLFSFLCIFRPYFRQAKRVIFNVHFVHNFQWLFHVIFNVYFVHDFQALFSCHLSRKKWAFRWCQKRTLFRTDNFLSLILFYSDISDSFSVRRSRRTTLFLRFVFRETSRCTYVPIWLTYACMLKNKTAFSWRNNQWIVLAVDFQKDSFERSLPFLFFIVAVLRPIFAQTLTASMFCFFAWSEKQLTQLSIIIWRNKRMWRFIVRPNFV